MDDSGPVKSSKPLTPISRAIDDDLDDGWGDVDTERDDAEANPAAARVFNGSGAPKTSPAVSKRPLSAPLSSRPPPQGSTVQHERRPPTSRSLTPRASEAPKSLRPRAVSVPPRASSAPTPTTSLAAPLTAVKRAGLAGEAPKPEPQPVTDLSESELTLLNPLPTDRETTAVEALPTTVVEPPELLQAPNPGAHGVAPAQAGPFAAEVPPASLEPTSLTPAVADVELSSALAQARRGRRTWAFSAVAAVVLAGVGTGFAIHQQQGPSLNKAPVQGAPVQLRPVAAAPQNAVKPQAPKPAAPPAVNPPEVSSVPAAAGDFAAAFAAAPNPDAKAYPEVIVRVSPLRAQIYDGPKLLAQTAARVSLPPGTKKTLMVHLEGYQSRQVLVDGSSESVNIVMRPAGGTPAEAPADAAKQAPVSAPGGPAWLVQSQQQRSKQQAADQASSASPGTNAAAKPAAEGDILPPL